MTPIFCFRWERARDRKARDVLLLFVASRQIDVDSLATAVESEIEANLIPDEILIVVRQPSFVGALELLQSSSALLSLKGRVERYASMSLIGYDASGQEASRAHVAGPTPADQVELNEVRTRGITEIFNARGGFVESTPAFHFENPSKRHTERFIRLSNILGRASEISFISFCILPYLPSAASIAYIDTPALYAIVGSLNEQISSFDSERSLAADNFQSYGGLANYAFARQAEAIVLISASSSGGLAERLVADYGFEREQIVHVLFLGREAPTFNVVCNLAYDAASNPNGIKTLPRVEVPERCSMCAAGSFAIKLNGDQFDVAGPQPEPLLILRNQAPPGLSLLMDRLAGRGILGVGMGGSDRNLPRQFDIDAEALMSSKPFRERLAYVLRRSVPAALSHVVLGDNRSAALAQAIVEHAASHGKQAQVVQRDQLDSIKPGAVGAVGVVTAAIESGRTLLDISRDLRSIVPKTPIFYLVGLEKTSGEQRREALSRTLAQTSDPALHEFISVERMTLPLSQDQHAWTRELDLFIDPKIQEIIPSELKAYIEGRIEALRRGSVALRKKLFLSNDPSRGLSLQPGFVFWSQGLPTKDHTQADVYFTIASVLQHLRAGGVIKNNWFQQTLLAPGNFGRFNDDVIQASLLRAARVSEMNYASAPDASREMARIVKRLLESGGVARGGAAAEFLLALATGTLQLCREDLADLLGTTITDAPVARFLQKACELRRS